MKKTMLTNLHHIYPCPIRSCSLIHNDLVFVFVGKKNERNHRFFEILREKIGSLSLGRDFLSNLAVSSL